MAPVQGSWPAHRKYWQMTQRKATTNGNMRKLRAGDRQNLQLVWRWTRSIPTFFQQSNASSAFFHFSIIILIVDSMMWFMKIFLVWSGIIEPLFVIQRCLKVERVRRGDCISFHQAHWYVYVRMFLGSRNRQFLRIAQSSAGWDWSPRIRSSSAKDWGSILVYWPLLPAPFIQ